MMMRLMSAAYSPQSTPVASFQHREASEGPLCCILEGH